MAQPQTPLTNELDHDLGESRLGEALMQYKRPSNTERWMLSEELLSAVLSLSVLLRTFVILVRRIKR